MIALVTIIALGALTWAIVAFAGRLAPSFRVPLAAAIMLGLAGYLIVGRPGLAGVVKAPPAREGFGEPLDDPRNGLATRAGPAAMWLGLSDGLLRSGNTEMAAEALQQGLRAHPRDVDLWVGFGNALVAHSGGVMTPAAEMAFQKAADIQPDHPAPPFFAGLALAQGGDLEGARTIWQLLLSRSPANAPWRADLESRLAQLPPPTPAAPPVAAAPANPPTTATPAAPAPADR